MPVLVEAARVGEDRVSQTSVDLTYRNIFAYTLNVFTSAPWRLYQNITQYPRDAGNSGEINLVVEVVEDECRLAWL